MEMAILAQAVAELAAALHKSRQIGRALPP